jgi:murein DD-endopeptidase MepM/ murein hydrolase activator NlpD
MVDVGRFRERSRGRRAAAIATGVVALVLVTQLLWSGERRRAELRDEVHWLRARLAEKRELISRQRREMAEVASAVEHAARTTSAVRQRAADARRVAQMEESRDPATDILPVSTVLAGGDGMVSEDTGRALQQLAWLEGQTAAVGDSLGVVTALLSDRADVGRGSVPSMWPVRGPITSRFGTRRDPWDDEPSHHFGIDIKARHGFPVTASGDGRVIFAGRDSGYGRLVIVDHGGDIDTFYAHLSAIYVQEGQTIRRGEPIGAVGSSGRATGTHLHYEVRVAGSPVDPRRYLRN